MIEMWRYSGLPEYLGETQLSAFPHQEVVGDKMMTTYRRGPAQFQSQKTFKLGKGKTKDSLGLTQTPHKWRTQSQSSGWEGDTSTHTKICLPRLDFPGKH